MTINIKNLCIALVFAMLAPFQVSADEVTDFVNEVAAKLVQQLPMDKILRSNLSHRMKLDFLKTSFENSLLTSKPRF